MQTEKSCLQRQKHLPSEPSQKKFANMKTGSKCSRGGRPDATAGCWKGLGGPSFGIFAGNGWTGALKRMELWGQSVGDPVKSPTTAYQTWNIRLHKNTHCLVDVHLCRERKPLS